MDGAMPRWNMLLLLPPKHRYEDIVRKLELPMTAFAHRAHWYFRDHTQARGTKVKHLGRVVGSYDPFGDVVAISYRPPGSDPSENFVCVDGKFKLPTRFIEPEWPWPAPACDPQARSPELIKQALESFLPDGWMLVVQGMCVIVPELEGSRAQRIVVLEGDPDREAFVKHWANGSKHVQFAIRSSRHSTEEEELDDEAELEDLSGEGGVHTDRSEEEEENTEAYEDDEAEERGDEDASDEEEDDDGEDVEDSDASESDDGEGVSRPSHNLSGNGRAATSRDTGMTNRDLGASREATRG